MTKELQASRLCSSCGQKKPLVAFLELVGGSHTYGNICSTCRGSSRDLKKPVEEVDESGSGTTRLQIDNKTKTQREHDQNEQLKENTELDYEEKTKKETLEEEKNNEAEQREEIEKKYREAYLEKTRQTPIAAKNDKEAATMIQEDQIAHQTQHFYSEKTRITTDFHNQAQGQQLGKKTAGLTPAYINRYVSATGRSAESLFGPQLGQFMRNHFQAQRKTGTTLVQEKRGQESKTTPETGGKKEKRAEPDKKEQKENAAIDFVRNNFKKR